MNELMEQLKQLQSTVQSNTEAVDSICQYPQVAAPDRLLLITIAVANLAMPFKMVQISLCTGEHEKDYEEEDKVAARFDVDMASVQWPAFQPIEDRKEALASYKREMEIGKGVVEESERRDVLRQSAGENLEFEETLDEVRIRLEDEYHKKHGDLGKKSAEVCYSTLCSLVILMVDSLPWLRVRTHPTTRFLHLLSTERQRVLLLKQLRTIHGALRL